MPNYYWNSNINQAIGAVTATFEKQLKLTPIVSGDGATALSFTVPANGSQSAYYSPTAATPGSAVSGDISIGSFDIPCNVTNMNTDVGVWFHRVNSTLTTIAASAQLGSNIALSSNLNNVAAGTVNLGSWSSTDRLVVELFDKFGTPSQIPMPDLDTADTITFVFKKQDTPDVDPPDLRSAGRYYVDPDDPLAYTGAVEYVWTSTDTSNLGQGVVRFEIDIEWSPGVIETVPNKGYFTLSIESDLD